MIKNNHPITQFLKIITTYFIFLFQFSRTSQFSHPKPPPIPILPIPKSHQISWQIAEMALFFHFGTNTFTNSEWGTGHVDPSIFNPTLLNATQWNLLNATQWVTVAKDFGFKRVVSTAKHHDGFLLWPSKCTAYSIKSSSWRNGVGDIVAELAEAARNGELEMELYLSPWDRHERCDGIYDGGDAFGHDWVPAECDVSIRPGWFWHASEKPKSAMTLLDLYYKSVGRNCLLLLNVPPNSSGLISDEDIKVLKEFSELRNSIFSHNFATSALVSASSTRGDPDDSQFGPKNVIEEGLYTYWAPDQGQQSDWTLYLEFQQVITFNVLDLQEPIQMGQRIIEFHLDMFDENGKWQHVVSGTTVGYRRLLLFPTVKSHLLRLVIDKSRTCPLISHLAIYMDSYSVSQHVSDTHTRSKFINKLVFRRTAYNRSQSVSI
ncbi:unnamed protein product [Withania somnifera]